MTSRNKPSSTPSKTTRTTSIYIWYLAGAALIASALMNASLIGPLMAVAIVSGVSACLYFISTPQGKAFIAKHSRGMWRTQLHQHHQF
jgi:hypothetical protein